MPSSAIAATTATSTHIPRKILSRSLVWEGGIIAIKVPADSKLGSAGQGIQLVHFLRFCRNAKGGVVNFHVHGKKPEAYRGKEINAEVKIFRKEMQGGEAYLYVDLISTREAPTHRLAIICPPKTILKAEGVLDFPVPYPLTGSIVLCPPNAKF